MLMNLSRELGLQMHRSSEQTSVSNFSPLIESLLDEAWGFKAPVDVPRVP